MSEETNISQLKDLYELLGDSRKGYMEAAKNVKEPRLTSFIAKLSQDRSEMQGALGQAIQRLDRDNSDLADGTLKGDLHRAWMDIRDKLTATDEAAMLAECKRGESYLQERFKSVIDDKNTPPAVLPILRKQLSSIDMTLSTIEQLHATSK